MRRLLSLFMFSCFAAAQPAYIASGGGLEFGSTTNTRSLGTVTAGTSIAVFVYWISTSATLDSVTACGDTLTRVQNPITGAGSRAAGAYIISSTGGTCNLVATFSGSVTSSMAWETFSGVTALDTSVGGFNNNTPTSTDGQTSGSVTTNTNGNYIFAGGAGSNGDTVTAGTGYTLGAVGGYYATEHRIQASAGSIAGTFTVTSAFQETETILMAFTPAASAARRRIDIIQ